MKRTTLFIEPEMERELQSLARREGRPVAALVREAVAHYVSAARDARSVRLGFIAAGRSGRRDIAETHEDLLFRENTSLTKRPAAKRPPRKAVRRNRGRGRG